MRARISFVIAGFLLATLFVHIAVAQNHLNDELGMGPRLDAATRWILSRQTQMGGAAHKTNAGDERLRAYAFYDDSVKRDSALYVYTDLLRGADHDPKNLDSYQDDFHPFGVDDFTPRQWRRSRFQYYDTAHRWLLNFNVSGAPLELAYTRIAKYDTGKNLVEFITDSASGVSTLYTLSRDGNGRDTACDFYLYLYGDSTPGPILANRTSVFNGADPLTDSFTDIQTGLPFHKSEHFYSAQSRLDSFHTYIWLGSAPYLLRRSLFTYTSAGLLETVLRMEAVPGWGDYMYKDSFAYQGNNPAYVYRDYKSYSPITGVWSIRHYYLTYSLNAQGMWDTVRIYNVNFSDSSYSTGGRYDAIKYGPNGNPTAITRYYDADSGGPLPPQVQQQQRYYYEAYGPATVRRAPKGKTSGLTFALGPNPTNGALRIGWTGRGAAPASYVVLDAAGRPMMKGTIPTNTNNLVLDLSRLAVGWYGMQICDTDGVICWTGQIVRR